MKIPQLMTILVVAVLAVAGYFVVSSETPTVSDEHGQAEPPGIVHADEDHDDHGHANETETGHAEDLIRLSDEHLRENDVTFARADSGTITQEITLPGEIVLNADRVAHIVPRFPGIAQKVLRDLGDDIHDGDVMAVIQSNQSVAPYEVTSLVSGTVIEKHLTLGEFVRGDADVYVVADLSTVWAKISVYAKYLPLVQEGLSVRLTAAGSGEVVEGLIDYVGPIVGERTRTGSARVVLRNDQRQWQPGLFITARISVGRFSVPMAVPDDAVQTVEGRPSVFVRTDDGFAVRPVQLGRSDGRTVEILSGLVRGEEYVAGNSFLLKAELGKSEAGHEH